MKKKYFTNWIHTNLNRFNLKHFVYFYRIEYAEYFNTSLTEMLFFFLFVWRFAEQTPNCRTRTTNGRLSVEEVNRSLSALELRRTFFAFSYEEIPTRGRYCLGLLTAILSLFYYIHFEVIRTALANMGYIIFVLKVYIQLLQGFPDIKFPLKRNK